MTDKKSKSIKNQKLYCYVDESGQDTMGAWFLVSIVLLDEQRKAIGSMLLEIEHRSGKHKTKWHKTKHKQRVKYLDEIINLILLKNSLYFSTYKNTTLFADLIALTIVKALNFQKLEKYKAQIIVDGLRKNLENQFAATIRKLGVETNKVKGARDESNPFVRLADSLAGLLRDNYEKKSWTNKYVDKLIENKYVHEI